MYARSGSPPKSPQRPYSTAIDHFEYFQQRAHDCSIPLFYCQSRWTFLPRCCCSSHTQEGCCITRTLSPIVKPNQHTAPALPHVHTWVTCRRDEDGSFWDVEVKPQARRLGFIVHKGDEKAAGEDLPDSLWRLGLTTQLGPQTACSAPV